MIDVELCRASNMTMVAGRSGVALGSWGRSFLLTNNADACRLDGYPDLFGLRDDGLWEQVPVRRTTDTYIPPPLPLAGPLAPGDTAEVRVQATARANYPNGECPTAPSTPVYYQALRFVLPGDPTPLEIDGALFGGCTLAISPFGGHQVLRRTVDLFCREPDQLREEDDEDDERDHADNEQDKR